MDLAAHQSVAPLVPAASTLRTLACDALAACHADLLAARHTVLSTRDPTGVHGTRVALRRLRAAATLFGRALADERILALRADAKQLADACGPTRDLDVFLAGVLAEIEAAVADQAEMADALRAFRLTALRLRRGRHDAVRRVLNGTTFSGFDARLAELLASAETDPASEVPAAPDGDSAGPDGAAAAVEMPAAPVADLPSPTDFARDTLRRRHRRLLKGLRRIGKLDGAARHELRLKTKKQRYAAGFLSKLFDPKAAAAYIQGAAAVQDALGLANDRLVATQVVADIRAAARPKGRLDWISGMLAGWLAMRAQAGGDDKALAAATKRLARAPRFWRGAARHHDGERQDERSG